MSLGEGGEIPKGGRAGRARFLGIWPWGGEIPIGFWLRGGRDHGARGGGGGGGGEIPGTPAHVFGTCSL